MFALGLRPYSPTLQPSGPPDSEPTGRPQPPQGLPQPAAGSNDSRVVQTALLQLLQAREWCTAPSDGPLGKQSSRPYYHAHPLPASNGMKTIPHACQGKVLRLQRPAAVGSMKSQVRAPPPHAGLIRPRIHCGLILAVRLAPWRAAIIIAVRCQVAPLSTCIALGVDVLKKQKQLMHSTPHHPPTLEPSASLRQV